MYENKHDDETKKVMMADMYDMLGGVEKELLKYSFSTFYNYLKPIRHLLFECQQKLLKEKEDRLEGVKNILNDFPIRN
jgi:hypothetical protein